MHAVVRTKIVIRSENARAVSTCAGGAVAIQTPTDGTGNRIRAICVKQAFLATRYSRSDARARSVAVVVLGADVAIVA